MSTSTGDPPERPVKVLLVDDEPALVEVMSVALSARGYEVVPAVNGVAALTAATVDEPDVVLLDLGLPDMDGIDVCRQLRGWFPNPIVILSADGAEDRVIAALDAGADDYVTKPFSTPQLMARLRVALRHRRLVAAVVGDATVEIGDVLIDPAAHVATVGGAALGLTRKEFALLLLLARNAGRVLVHRAILDHVWPDGSGTSNSLRVHVTNLRRKLGAGPGRPTIDTEPGVGYRMVGPEDER